MFDKWLSNNIELTYKDLFDVISDNESLKRYAKDDEIEEVAFSILLDIYKELNNCSPYDVFIINNLKK